MSSITTPAWYNELLAPPITYAASACVSVITGSVIAPNRILLAAGIMSGFWIIVMVASHVVEGIPHAWLHTICVIVGAILGFIYARIKVKADAYNQE